MLNTGQTVTKHKSKISYYVVRCLCYDWIKSMKTNTNIICVDYLDRVPRNNKTKIIPLTLNNMHTYWNDSRLLYRTDIKVMCMMNDKCMFSDFMMKNFPNNYPKVYYMNSIHIVPNTYIDDEYKLSEVHCSGNKLIKKPSYGGASKGVLIMYQIKDFQEKNVVITDYIEHNEYYVGHFFVSNGKIIKQIYFKASTNGIPNFILRTIITRNLFKTRRSLVCECEENIFDVLFCKLNYSGFACSDFVICDRKIIVFEINPRPGGSLFHHKETCKSFFECVTNNQYYNVPGLIKS